MLKKISSINGAKVLSIEEQRSVKGGRGCDPNNECCGVCTCGISNWFAYPGQLCCSTCCNGGPVYAGPGCV